MVELMQMFCGEVDDCWSTVAGYRLLLVRRKVMWLVGYYNELIN